MVVQTKANTKSSQRFPFSNTLSKFLAMLPFLRATLRSYYWTGLWLTASSIAPPPALGWFPDAQGVIIYQKAFFARISREHHYNIVTP